MAIGPISPITVPSAASISAPTSTTSATSTAGTQSTAGSGDAFTNALDQLSAQQGTADSLAQQAATGQVGDVSQYLVAATEAQLSTQLTVAVRNKAVEAFNDIMRMQV